MSSGLTPSRVQPQQHDNVGRRRVHFMQKLAWGYAAMFVGIASLSYIPGLTDASGSLFGLFSLQIHDDLLHLGSGIWAGWAAWRSAQAATLYFKLFGAIYSLDAVLGLLFGQGYLDAGIFRLGITPLDIVTKIATNLPHVLIGGIALLIGFVVSRRYAPQS